MIEVTRENVAGVLKAKMFVLHYYEFQGEPQFSILSEVSEDLREKGSHGFRDFSPAGTGGSFDGFHTVSKDALTAVTRALDNFRRAKAGLSKHYSDFEILAFEDLSEVVEHCHNIVKSKVSEFVLA